MDVVVKEVQSKKELKTFIHLPAKIHKNHSNWVPPVYMDEKVYFSPTKNRSFSYSDVTLALAYRGKEVVGRIMGIINHRYNDAHNEKNGRFSQMEYYKDPEVAHALITYVENWSRQRGMTHLVGPLGFSDKDPQGFLIDGYEKPHVLSSNCNFEYNVKDIEAEGYEKRVDLVVYKVDVPKEIPEVYQRIYERALAKNRVNILEFTKRSELKPMIRPVFHLVNETFKEIYAFAPFEEYEMDDYAKRYIAIMDPRFLKVITNQEGEIIAFILGMPDIGEGIKKAKGYVLPFGFFHIIRSQKKTKQLDLLLGAVKEKYRGQGLDVLMGIKMLESASKAGLEVIDSHLELEGNTKMRMEMEKWGGQVYKRFRVFQKTL